jgi:hypothetical protein
LKVLETKIQNSDTKETDIDKKSRELAQRFVKTNDVVKERLSAIELETQVLNLKRISSLPMDKAYT